jgi:branched-chain amino acid transport system permease protein
MEVLLQHLVSGLLIGGVLALLAGGLALIFGVMGMVNFAHGDIVMLGMYGALIVVGTIAAPFSLASLILLPVFLALGWGLHRLVIAPVLKTRSGSVAGHDAQLLLTLGLSLILQNAALMFFGADPRGGASGDAIVLSGIVIDPQRLIAGVVGVVATVALYLFLQRTRYGRGMRAAAADSNAASDNGVDVVASQRLAFALGTGMAGVGGALLAGFYPVQPFVSFDFIILMFAAVVLGGLGSVVGAAVGGIVIGVVMGLGQLVLPLQLQNLGVFAVFLLVLFVRPQGLLGMRARL